MIRSLLLALVLTSVASADLIQPSDLEYKGCFLAPSWRAGGVRWGYGMAALTFNPDGDGGKGSLFGSSHQNFRQVGECSIPSPVMPTNGLAGLPRSKDLQPFGDVTGQFRQTLTDTTLDRFGGLELLDGYLYWCFHRYYAVQPLSVIDDPTFGRSRLTLNDPQEEGLWRVGESGNNLFHQKITSNYMTTIPKEWADAHANGWRLAVGKGDGAGSITNSQGPAIAAVNQNDVSEAVNLLFYSVDNRLPGWSACDTWEGFAWIGGDKEAVVLVGSRGLGPNQYGAPEPDDCRTSKGNHCDPYGVQCLLYSPSDLAEVAAGARESTDVLPYATIDLEPIFDAAIERCEPSTGGMAYDVARRRLYLVQNNQENPVIHVWGISGNASTGVVDPTDPTPDPDPEPEPQPDDHAAVVLEVQALSAKVDLIMAKLDQLDGLSTRLDEVKAVVLEIKTLTDAIKDL